MPLAKQNLSINFAQGLDTKSDPFQVMPGKFLSLQNTIFGTTGLLQKRNGYQQLALTASPSATSLQTYNGNLTAIGSSLYAFSQASETWINKGPLQPCSLSTLPLVRSSLNQTQCDSAVASNGLVCTVFTNTNGSTTTRQYQIADSNTGQVITNPINIPISSGAIVSSPRVFLLGAHFIIVFVNTISSSQHLQYIAISTMNPLSVSANTDISTQITMVNVDNFDGVVANNTLYVAWNGSDGGGAIRVRPLSSTLTLGGVQAFTGKASDKISICADTTASTPQLYIFFWDGSSGWVFSFTQNLVTIFSFEAVFTLSGIPNITCAAADGICSMYYELTNGYAYDSSVMGNQIVRNSVTLTGTVSSASFFGLGVGLASKAFAVNDVIYILAVYDQNEVIDGTVQPQSIQPTYFLLMDQGINIFDQGLVVSKLAYSNAGGYLTLGLPSVNISGGLAQLSYLTKDLTQAANKTQGSSNLGVYSQLGINLANFNLMPAAPSTSEIGDNLNISGGILWMYDGAQAVEQGFLLFPESIEAAWATSGGAIHAQPDGSTNTDAYFYQVTYEWSDNQGNIFRSAPSIPIAVTTSGSGTSGEITLDIPTLKMTYKKNVVIVIYRWSVAQQVYYQVTSIAAPLLNNSAIDYVTYVDKLADASILGNNILYTTGGVIENIAAPATDNLTLFKSRLFLVDAEDRNLLWYSKQVIEDTSPDMSDLFTLYVAPTTGAQGSTGNITALSVMDDKLLIFKKDAVFYLVGTGPDNTGANNDFSDPIFITSTVGCANQASIVFIPQGLVFQSDKGIWILGRDLSTSYIGADVQQYNSDLVISAQAIPGTNQVRFILNSGTTLVYDYYYAQWSTFTLSGISSILYQGLFTYITSNGQVFQETPGLYLDGSLPVEMQFTTGWMSFAGLQGFERAYEFYLLATYLTPHYLQLQISYDFNTSPSQTTFIYPTNYSNPYGSDSFYGGGSPYGGPAKLEQWRVFLERQQCQSFQMSLQEIYDPSFGVQAGAGLTISGLDLVFGLKKAYPRNLSAGKQVG